MSPRKIGAIGDPCEIRRRAVIVTVGARVEEAEARRRIEQLRTEHRDLDDAIRALGDGAAPDQLQIARLKRRKLKLRDEIARIEDHLIPDIIA